MRGQINPRFKEALDHHCRIVYTGVPGKGSGAKASGVRGYPTGTRSEPTYSTATVFVVNNKPPLLAVGAMPGSIRKKAHLSVMTRLASLFRPPRKSR